MKVALYVRTANDDNKDVLLCQEDALRRWAEEHGHEVIATYQDLSPGTSLNRPGLQALIRELASELFEAVLVMNFDRIIRGLDCVPQLADAFQSAGVKVISPAEPEDALTPAIQLLSIVKELYYAQC